MKQTIFMIVLTLMGTVGVYTVNAFWGVAVYYLFAVLRPQYMWKWSLPEDVSWSFYVAVATTMAVVLGFHQAGPRPTFRLSAGHKCLAAFGAWIVLTAVTAQSFDASYPTLVEYVKIFTMVGVSTIAVRSFRHVWALFLIAAAAVGYIAYEVNYLYLVNSYLGIYKKGYGGLDNNGAALMLAMGVPLCWFAYEGMRHRCRWLYLGLIPIIIHAVLMTYSRGAMVSLIAVTPWLVFRSSSRVRLSLVLGVVGLVGVPIMAGQQIRERFMTIEKNEVDESANQRRAAWRAAWKMAVDHPLVGVGVRNANLFSHQYGADKEGRTIHSQYFQILADNGFIGLGLYLMVFLATFFNTWRARRSMRGRTDEEARRVRAMASGLECSLVLYSVGSAFLSMEIFELPYLLILLAAQLSGLSGHAVPDPTGDSADERLLGDSEEQDAAEEELFAPPCLVRG